MKLFSLCAISSATGFILQTTPVAPVGYNQTTGYDLDDVLSPTTTTATTTTTTASTGTASKKVKMMIYSSPGSWVWGPPTDSFECGQGIGDCRSGFCCSEDGWCGRSSAYCHNPKHDFRPYLTEYTGECFNDYGNIMWPKSQYHEDPNNNDKDYCRNRCSSMGFKYYGLQARTWCNCGNEAPNSNLIVDQSECNMSCSGNAFDICGGDWRMNVYTIQYTNKDVDECATGHHDCDANATCANSPPGSFTCTCKTGYDGDGKTCVDIDECKKHLDDCGSNTICNNNDGSYTCDCKAGFVLDFAAGKCIDVNECADDARCGDNSKCTNTEGSYTCTCNTGFALVSGKCVDVDECADAATCGDNAKCSNTEGSYTCTCITGFVLVSGKCVDNNECADATRCGDNAKCTNTEGSYTCTCNTGFDLVSGTCSDVDECDNGDNDCDGNATCTNNDGAFSCECNDGYSGDGRTCQKDWHGTGVTFTGDFGNSWKNENFLGHYQYELTDVNGHPVFKHATVAEITDTGNPWVYLYYWLPYEDWRIGPNYLKGAGWATTINNYIPDGSQNDIIKSLTEDKNWRVWNNEAYEDQYLTVSFNDWHGTGVTFTGDFGNSWKNENLLGHYQYELTDVNGRPVFKHATVEEISSTGNPWVYLYYWLPSKDWLIGANYLANRNWAHTGDDYIADGSQNDIIKSLTEDKNWRVWNNEAYEDQYLTVSFNDWHGTGVTFQGDFGNSWKNENLLGHYQYELTDLNGYPVFKHATVAEIQDTGNPWVYLYYWLPYKDWRIGKNYREGAAWAESANNYIPDKSQNDIIKSLTKDGTWIVWNNDAWESQSITVSSHEKCPNPPCQNG